MACKVEVVVLTVLTLGALIQSTVGAPTDLPTEELSGEGYEGVTDLLSQSPVWKSLLDATNRHKKEFETEFTDSVQYLHLDNYNISSFPEDCRNTSLNMEGCLRRLIHGLQVYQVLLRHVEREYPLSEVLPNAKYFSSILISAARQKMKKPDMVKVLSSGEEQSLLKEVDRSDNFQRKMLAHNILRKLHEFLRDTQIDIKRRERRTRYVQKAIV